MKLKFLDAILYNQDFLESGVVVGFWLFERPTFIATYMSVAIFVF